jgi:glutathione S-transferase
MTSEGRRRVPRAPDPVFDERRAPGDGARNAIADTRDGLRDATPDDLAASAAGLRASRMRFEALLSGSRWLSGEWFGVADIVIAPFVRFAAGPPRAAAHA